MFDDAKDELDNALASTDEALPKADAKDTISGGGLLADNVIESYAETTTEDGTTYVVSTEALDRDLPLPTDDAEDAQTDADAASAGAEAQETQTTTQTTSQSLDGDVDLTSDEQDTYEVNGLEIDKNPQRMLAGEPTGKEVYGAEQLTNTHPAVPHGVTPYYPVDLGERDTEEVFYRALAMEMPVIIEGEAGTGKNVLASSAGSRLNYPVYRQEFGSDTTVMDVVGEKDLDGDGGTYYIVGKAAQAAMFGGIYVADEINMATGSVTSYLHPLFEERGKRELELRGTGRTLRDLPEDEEWDPEKHLGKYIHPKFRAVGTCNPLHYADTKEMNDALRSRCLVIEHPYLADAENDDKGIEMEASLLADETGCDPDNPKIIRLVRTAAVLRESRREANVISVPIGHRELRDTVELAGPSEGFMSYKEAAKIKMVGQASLKQDKQTIRDTIEDEL